MARRVGEDGERGGGSGNGYRGGNAAKSDVRSSGYNPTDIPYRDAVEEIGEVPIGQLDSFVHPARDDKGATDHFHFNIPPYLNRAIQIILHSKRFPYLDFGSFMRHAAVRHVMWLVSIRQSLPRSMMALLESMSESCRDVEMRIQCEDALRRVSEIVDRCLAHNEFHEATRLVSMILQRIEDTEPSARQREFKRKFMARFGRFLVTGQLGPEDCAENVVSS